jgi:hypothetical protein
MRSLLKPVKAKAIACEDNVTPVVLNASEGTASLQKFCQFTDSADDFVQELGASTMAQTTYRSE